MWSCHKPPKGFSWIKVWKHRTRYCIPQTCCFKSCKNQLSSYNRVGAHICIEGFNKYVYKSIYIVPCCKSCNSQNGLFVEIGTIDNNKIEHLISKHDHKSAGLFRYYKKFTVLNKNIEDLKCKTI